MKLENENKQMDKNAFYLQEIKRVGQSFYSLFDLILKSKQLDIIISLSFVILNACLLK